MKQIILNTGDFALVDDSDYESLVQYRWYLLKDKGGRRYAIRIPAVSEKLTRTLSLHRHIMQPGTGVSVDHKDGNGLNNQRDNLRIISHRSNIRAFQRKRPNCSSKYRGVHWSKTRSVWIASICLRKGNKMQHVFKQCFADENEAAKAYNAAALALGFLPEALNKIA
jgi:hypothetical protein